MPFAREYPKEEFRDGGELGGGSKRIGGRHIGEGGTRWQLGGGEEGPGKGGEQAEAARAGKSESNESRKENSGSPRQLPYREAPSRPKGEWAGGENQGPPYFKGPFKGLAGGRFLPPFPFLKTV